MLKEKWGEAARKSARIADGACGRHLVISAMLSPPFGAALIEKGPYRRSVGFFHYPDGKAMFYDRVIKPGQDYVVLERQSVLDPPFPAEVTGNPAFRGYNFVEIQDGEALPPNCRAQSRAN
jgi:hypothetical protein